MFIFFFIVTFVSLFSINITRSNSFNRFLQLISDLLWYQFKTIKCFNLSGRKLKNSNQTNIGESQLGAHRVKLPIGEAIPIYFCMRYNHFNS